MSEANYLTKNKAAWNTKTAIHTSADFYKHQEFLQGENSLKEIELTLLGDVSGKKILHLQCHFGQDTLSLARMGASVTGIDFSDKAIELAQKTATDLTLQAKFICCDLYELPQYLDEQYDIVFTSYGTIGWLPDIDRWAAIVSKFLKPDGEFIFVEFHPVLWMYDNDQKEVAYNYFCAEEIIEVEDGSYADREAPVKIETITWNHGLGEVIQALIDQGLSLLEMKEYDYSPYNIFKESEVVGISRYRLKAYGNKLPLVYSLKMIKE